MLEFNKDDHVVAIGNKNPVKLWTIGVNVEQEAKEQIYNVADMPFIFKHIAVMPDCHSGMGATIGSVIPTDGAIIPAAVGVDIGCGIMGAQTTLSLYDLPKDLHNIRLEIEAAVPHGRSENGGPGDIGAWEIVPDQIKSKWFYFSDSYNELISRHKGLKTKTPPEKHLGTLGTGNHFIELCLDENNKVWILLHSGSRGIGNRIGTYFIQLAKQEMEKYFIKLIDNNLAYFPEDTKNFDDYMFAVSFAQKYAAENRELMLNAIVKTLHENKSIPEFELINPIVNCHHNYVARENHFGKNVLVTRKGAIRARKGDIAVIPGSMGTKSFIVEGLGNEDSFTSASHGAGRKMSRTAAKKQFTLEEHTAAVTGVECRIDNDILDETPGAYKDIEDVMVAQKNLVSIVHTLKQIICIKG
jgi:tRNA-splicing ligase RtcB